VSGDQLAACEFVEEETILLRFIKVVTLLVVLLASLPVRAAIRPQNVVVIYNTNEPMSLAVAQYYCSKAEIPASHMIGVSAIKDHDYIVASSTDEYDGSGGIKDVIENALLNSGLGLTSANYATDPM